MSSGPAGQLPRLFLHVGSPKTGTTFLQNVLWSQRERAREQGLLLPMERFHDHYLASLDVRGLSGRPVHPPRAVGMWGRMVEEAASWSGSVLISHELFAATTAGQATEALAALDGRVEVHVVVTARDMVRQMSAEWQEHVKHRSTKTFGEFVRDLRDDTARTSWFWRVQDFAGVVERWGAGIPPDRLHVITVPPSGTSPQVLWERFAGLLGLEPGSFDTEVSRSNTSLGVEQAELLRRVNIELGDRLPLPGPYPTVVKNVLAHQILSEHKGTRLTLSPVDADFAVEQSAAIAARLTELEVDIVGDLAELVPDAEQARAGASPNAYEPPDSEILLAESVAAVADLLVELSNRRARQQRVEQLLGTMRRKPLRFALLQASERHPSLMRLRRLYTRTRRRSGG